MVRFSVSRHTLFSKTGSTNLAAIEPWLELADLIYHPVSDLPLTFLVMILLYSSSQNKTKMHFTDLIGFYISFPTLNIYGHFTNMCHVIQWRRFNGQVEMFTTVNL